MTTFNPVTLLQAAVPDIEPNGNGGWNFAVAPGRKKGVGLQVQPNWATIRCAMSSVRDELPLNSILQQAAWPGGVKLAFTRSGLALRAEIPLLTQTAADSAWTVSQFRGVLKGLRSATGLSLLADADEHDDCREAGPEMLAERCRAAGWKAEVKTDDEVHVPIESRSVRRVVSIVRRAKVLRASVTLGGSDLVHAGKERLQATAHYMQRASSTLRFVRAWATGTSADPAEMGFECVLALCSGDAPLVTAVDALAMACDHFGSEAEALLENVAIAQQYLNCFGHIRAEAPDTVVPRRASPVIASELFAATQAVP